LHTIGFLNLPSPIFEALFFSCTGDYGAVTEDLAKAEVIIPDVASMERIGGVLQPIYNLVINQRIENRKLSMLRDSLLPKLMSGELDVSAIEL